ncbi:glutathione S-transferase family protein [Caulobacter sp. NIBR1757]|uniref:glutathione S-transferase family protein n=1 Tax=Caulobacter sp. NIBR1757 TaxID=3016000 RepID=UPI0022EFF7B4|nr:glutathione S-transferase family protein [Caulobacter sp. NIBR1757]WGM39268.1 Glutathione S-transferase GST-6.0 [Caulobacter sp. NIBR1757]
MLTLFYQPGSASDVARIALEEAGADYRALRVDLSKNEQREPQYLAINPKGRVPALVTDEGVLTENVAILGWIAQAFPEARLAPDDAFGFARVQAFNAYIASTVHVAYAHWRRANRWADDPAAQQHLRDVAPERYAACFQTIEDEMFEGPWVLGEDFTTSDIYLFVFADWLDTIGVDVRRFPKVHAHRERVRARPAVRKVLAQQAA